MFRAPASPLALAQQVGSQGFPGLPNLRRREGPNRELEVIARGVRERRKAWRGILERYFEGSAFIYRLVIL